MPGASDPPATAAQSLPATLPTTGASLTGMAAIGAGFLLAGGGILLAARAAARRKARRR